MVRCTVGELAQGELLPQPFAYKIIKKLCKAGLVQITRGAAGGCRLSADLSQATLYGLLATAGTSDSKSIQKLIKLQSTDQHNAI